MATPNSIKSDKLSAVFLFVAPSEVLAVADRFNATAFDIENTHWSHR